MQKNIVRFLPYIGCFFWLIYTAFYIHFRKNVGTETIAGYLSFFGETSLDLVAAVLTFRLFKKNINNDEKFIYLFFFIAFTFGFFADGIYNIILNIMQINDFSVLVDSLFDVPFIGFLLFQVVAWSLIFVKNNDSKNDRLIAYIPAIFIAIVIFCIFVFGIQWKLRYLSIEGIYQLIDTMLEVIGFFIAINCLARSKNKIIWLLATGYMVVISSDLIIRYSVVENILKPGNPLETTWVLGLLIMTIGFFLSKISLLKPGYQI